MKINPSSQNDTVQVSAHLETGIFQQLQDAIADGRHRELFPVGTLLPDTWTNLETSALCDMPLRIVDYRKIKLASGEETLGATLLRQHATPNLVAFCKSSLAYPFGSNEYFESDVRAYLDTEYYKGCSAALLSSLANIRLDDKADARFFLPSLEALHFDDVYLRSHTTYKNKPAWEYFQDTPSDPAMICSKRAICDPDGNKRQYLTRTRHNGSAECVYIVTVDGGAHSLNLASYVHPIAPACVIVGNVV